MTIPEIKSHVQRAIDCVYAHDSALFKIEASEWAIAHRLAVYLEKTLPGWNVDCEYNRQGSGRDAKTNELKQKIRPDITVHHRTEPAIEHNLIAIEVKKREDAADWTKVSELTTPAKDNRKFQYRYGLALSFFPALETHWYENGTEIPNA